MKRKLDDKFRSKWRIKVKKHFDKGNACRRLANIVLFIIASPPQAGYKGYLTIEREVGENPIKDVQEAKEYLSNLMEELCLLEKA